MFFCTLRGDYLNTPVNNPKTSSLASRISAETNFTNDSGNTDSMIPQPVEPQDPPSLSKPGFSGTPRCS
ncbi:unnamed protein product [Gongylonema pulchrum]|uniref:Uncharacterized protein n=1 Tax=Gongylonema pulchrum TaxID=637853 RepID=A0A183E361_9BILA|nr:unnamed protein product [Gongylonema pulchrum]